MLLIVYIFVSLKSYLLSLVGNFKKRALATLLIAVLTCVTCVNTEDNGNYVESVSYCRLSFIQATRRRVMFPKKPNLMLV